MSTKAKHNGKRLQKLAAGEFDSINLWRTEKTGTASGTLYRDVYVGTLRRIDITDSTEFAPSNAEYSVDNYGAHSHVWETLGWIYKNSDDSWTALVDTDYGVESVGRQFTTAIEATRAITGK